MSRQYVHSNGLGACVHPARLALNGVFESSNQAGDRCPERWRPVHGSLNNSTASLVVGGLASWIHKKKDNPHDQGSRQKRWNPRSRGTLQRAIFHYYYVHTISTAKGRLANRRPSNSALHPRHKDGGTGLISFFSPARRASPGLACVMRSQEWSYRLSWNRVASRSRGWSG